MLNVLPEEERSHGTISNKMYFTYVNEGGNIVLTFLLVVVYLASEVRLNRDNSQVCNSVHRVVLSQQTGGYQSGNKISYIV